MSCLRAADLGAQVGLRRRTEDAALLATLGSVARDHVIPGRDGSDARPHVNHYRTSLVAKNAGEEAVRGAPAAQTRSGGGQKGRKGGNDAGEGGMDVCVYGWREGAREGGRLERRAGKVEGVTDK